MMKLSFKSALAKLRPIGVITFTAALDLVYMTNSALGMSIPPLNMQKRLSIFQLCTSENGSFVA